MKIITFDMLTDRMKKHFQCCECGAKVTYLMSFVGDSGGIWLCKGCMHSAINTILDKELEVSKIN